MKKVLITLLLVVGFAFVSTAQNAKMKEKATEKVEELNAQIMQGDETLALTEEQKTAIYEIQLERLVEVKKLRKSGADKEAIKAENKKHFQKIYKEVLSKKQMKARRTGKQKMKSKN